MELQDAYKKKMAAQLQEWSAQINLWEAQLENTGADIRIKRVKALQELRAKQHAASGKMSELEKSSGAAWEQVKETADKIWDDLKAGVADAQSKFK